MKRLIEWWMNVDPVLSLFSTAVFVSVVSGSILGACSPVAEALDGEPIQSPARTYTVENVGKVTAWHDISSGNDCYFWFNHMFCVKD